MNIGVLIKQGESETLEFKESTGEWKEIIETISAFSNTHGGRIVIGVSKQGHLLGVEIGKGTIECLANQISQNIDPRIHPRITVEKIKGKSLIVIEVKESHDHLVLAFGRPYKRAGRSTLRMSKDEYERSILEKHRDKLQFDKQICKDAKLKDIDWKFVKEEFIPLYEKISERKVVGTPQSLLESLGCIKNARPTNPGILLFGKEPQKFFMNAYIALARYKGREEDIERLDYKEFNGNLFLQIDNSDKYIKDHIAVMSKLLPYRVQREDIPEYGLFSIRELITNAVCHRDYENQHTKTIIKMFSDRIEYYNPGGLPEEITPKNIVDRQYSRNPIIAKVLAKVKYIEELGEGWNKIIKEHKAHLLKPKMPKIRSDKNTTIVTIFSTKDKFEKKKEFISLNERQNKIMDYINVQGRINRKAAMELLQTSKDTAVRELSSLLAKGLVKRVGRGKSTYYHLA